MSRDPSKRLQRIEPAQELHFVKATALLRVTQAKFIATGLPPAPMDPRKTPVARSDLQGLVGQPRSTLDRMRFAVPLRVIEPGMAVTMDYSAQRLNIELDAAGRIQRVSCG